MLLSSRPFASSPIFFSLSRRAGRKFLESPCLPLAPPTPLSSQPLFRFFLRAQWSPNPSRTALPPTSFSSYLGGTASRNNSIFLCEYNFAFNLFSPLFPSFVTVRSPLAPTPRNHHPSTSQFHDPFLTPPSLPTLGDLTKRLFSARYPPSPSFPQPRHRPFHSRNPPPPYQPPTAPHPWTGVMIKHC